MDYRHVSRRNEVREGVGGLVGEGNWVVLRLCLFEAGLVERYLASMTSRSWLLRVVCVVMATIRRCRLMRVRGAAHGCAPWVGC